MASLPHLVKTGKSTIFLVDDQPFLMRAGELANSHTHNSPDPLTREMIQGAGATENSFWPRLKTMGLNTVLAPVTWEQIEPLEGQFNFESVDGLLKVARENGLRLVLLWFGSWKNSMSSYSPHWVKTDTQRFPRTRDTEGVPEEIMTPFAPNNWQADAAAFGTLMAHLREVDQQHTVIMVQVENEIGMLPTARDHSDLANEAYAKPVPTELLPAGHRGGNWVEVFGDSPATEEKFMAWAFAKYVEEVTSAGKTELNLPMYTNAALPRPNHEPGQYPSAGPLPHLVEFWTKGAPSLDFIAPDIYFPNFAQLTQWYVDAGQPLFVPEALRSIDAAANALYVFGRYGALGFSPFTVEGMKGEPAAYLTGAYDIVRQLTPQIVAHAGDGNMTGLLSPVPDSAIAGRRHPERVRLGDIVIQASYETRSAPDLADGVINETGQAAGVVRLPAAAIVIKTGENEYLAAGVGVTMTFHPVPPAKGRVGILACEEGYFDVESNWHILNWLNGDQTHQGRHIRLEPGRFAIQKFQLYRYE